MTDRRVISRSHHIASWACASIVILLIFSACGSGLGDGTNAPVLEYQGMNKDSMDQGQTLSDSIVVRMLFEDIDGDIEGSTPTFKPNNIVLTDSRDGDVSMNSFPGFPDLSTGQKGRLDLSILTTCCINPETVQSCSPSDRFPTNTYTIDIYIVDAQGNKSNTITTDPITLRCN